MRGRAIVMVLLVSGLGEPLDGQAAHPYPPVEELAPDPYIGPHAVPSTRVLAPLRPLRSPSTALPRSAWGGSSRPALAPSPYELGPLTELAPDPYDSMAWLAPDPYIDRRAVGQASALTSVSHERSASRRRAAEVSPGPALAPSPYELAPADLAPDPY